MNYLFDTLQMIGSLLLILLVLVLAYYATRWYARRVGSTGVGKHIKIIDKATLNPGTSLAVVEVGGQYYLLGVGDKSVRLLCELPDDIGQSGTGDPSQAAAPFSQILQGMLGKTQKKDDDERK
jgi:flagellar biosynthetic protein FliO